MHAGDFLLLERLVDQLLLGGLGIGLRMLQAQEGLALGDIAAGDGGAVDHGLDFTYRERWSGKACQQRKRCPGEELGYGFFASIIC